MVLWRVAVSGTHQAQILGMVEKLKKQLESQTGLNCYFLLSYEVKKKKLMQINVSRYTMCI